MAQTKSVIASRLRGNSGRSVLFVTPPVYQAPLPLEVHLPMIPQGPAMLGAVLQARGHRVAAFDAYEQSCRLRYFDSHEFEAVLARASPDVIGFSVYSDGFPAVLRMIEIAKAVIPHARIVVGGPHFTLFPDAVPADVDFVVVGEGEVAMAAIVEDAIPQLRGKGPRDCGFLLYDIGSRDPYDGSLNLRFEVVDAVPSEGSSRSRGALQFLRADVRVAQNGATRVLTIHQRLANEVLGRLPFPAYDLFLRPGVTYQQEEPALGLEGPMLNLNTSRGCSYGCSFCSVEGVWGKPYRWFPSEWIVRLVASLQDRYGLRSIFFREDEFIMRPRACSAWTPGTEKQDDILQLAQGLHELGVCWAVENRADAFGHPDHAEAYFESLVSRGLAGVFVGIESASATVRNDILNKHLSDEAIRRFFFLAHRYGVRTVANVMFGLRRRVAGELLTDGVRDWEQTETELRSLRPTRIDRYVYVGVPVSPLYFDFLEREDYEYIDVNGYLYPRGFFDLASRIYASGGSMTLVAGTANLKVGPGLLPGIPGPSGDEEGSRALLNAQAEGKRSVVYTGTIWPV